MPEPAVPPLERVLARSEHGARSIVDLALKVDRQRPAATNHVRPAGLKRRLTRTVSSNPVLVPRGDWAKVAFGTKPMFRTYAPSWRDRYARLFPEDEQFPRPAIIYSPGQGKLYHAALAVILEYRQEPLGAISRADLDLEGFRDIKQFRRYWRYRYVHWGYRPMDMISVVHLRPWQPDDDSEQGAWLLERVFGDIH